MKTPDEQSAFRALVPLLDEALLSLREKDRTALLLRFYESRPLRDVGASLGVGEDAAQKRVAGALERLVQFFRRRGYKTATIAVAAAALEHTAAAAPAMIASSVIRAAAQLTPPAACLGSVLARVASLTKAETALLCVTIVAAPTALQWSRLRAAEKEMAQTQSNYEASRSQLVMSRTRVVQLRAESSRLEGELTEAARAQARNAAALGKLSELKQRLHSLLGEPDYHWPTDLPFVRIPKWATTNMGSDFVSTFDSHGKLSRWADEILDLSPEQKQGIEGNLQRYLGDLNGLADSRAYETNATSATFPDPKGYDATKTISIPALGDAGGWIKNNLLTNVEQIAGGDLPRLISGAILPNGEGGSQILGEDLMRSSQQFTLGVATNGPDAPKFFFDWSGHQTLFGGTGWGIKLPPFLVQRFEPWLQQMGVTNNIFPP